MAHRAEFTAVELGPICGSGELSLEWLGPRRVGPWLLPVIVSGAAVGDGLVARTLPTAIGLAPGVATVLPLRGVSAPSGRSRCNVEQKRHETKYWSICHEIFVRIPPEAFRGVRRFSPILGDVLEMNYLGFQDCFACFWRCKD